MNMAHAHEGAVCSKLALLAALASRKTLDGDASHSDGHAAAVRRVQNTCGPPSPTSSSGSASPPRSPRSPRSPVTAPSVPTQVNLAGRFLPFDEARAFAHALKLRTKSTWEAWRKSGQRPHNIPTHPDTAYKYTGWRGYGHWLGTSKGDARRSSTKKILPGTGVASHGHISSAVDATATTATAAATDTGVEQQHTPRGHGTASTSQLIQLPSPTRGYIQATTSVPTTAAYIGAANNQPADVLPRITTTTGTHATATPTPTIANDSTAHGHQLQLRSVDNKGWEDWVLNLKAKERNRLVKTLSLTEDEAHSLRIESRKKKQRGYQQRYASQRGTGIGSKSQSPERKGDSRSRSRSPVCSPAGSDAAACAMNAATATIASTSVSAAAVASRKRSRSPSPEPRHTTPRQQQQQQQQQRRHTIVFITRSSKSQSPKRSKDTTDGPQPCGTKLSPAPAAPAEHSDRSHTTLPPRGQPENMPASPASRDGTEHVLFKGADLAPRVLALSARGC